MSDNEKEELKKEILITAKANGKFKLLVQVLTAILCVVSTIISFAWTGRGWVDDLKTTVKDNATMLHNRMDSLHNSHEYRISDLEKDRTKLMKQVFNE